MIVINKNQRKNNKRYHNQDKIDERPEADNIFNNLSFEEFFKHFKILFWGHSE